MLKARSGSLAVLFLTVALGTAPAQAEMLLAEIGWNQPDPITVPAFFDFTVVDPMPNYQASITTGLTSPDQTMAMTLIDQNDHPGSIALFNRVLAHTSNPGVRAYIANDGQIIAPPFGHGPFDAIWFPDSDPNDGFHAMAHVPPTLTPHFGLGLHGYWLTSVKQVVTPIGQTVYFYGIVIPEPSTGLLALLACMWHLNRRCRELVRMSGRSPHP
jgi:hypothetical protein